MPLNLLRQRTKPALGLAWFYGDVVHADLLRRAEGDAFGINERYRAAATCWSQ